MKFSKHKLGELLRITRGASLPGTGYADEGRYLRLTLANFHEEGGFKKFKSTQGKYFVDSFDNRFLMHKGDLITPLTEQSPGLLGSVAFIPSDDLYIQSQDVGLITCSSEKLDKRFAYYLFLTKSVREQISARSQQTKIRHTSPDKIADVEAYLPDLPTQLRIAAILGSIDEKIELNRKKIAELEALAKTIYDYWFVQFDFPDKNGKPYKSSGSKMVWNEQLKREIPEGWEVVTFASLIAKVANTRRLTTNEYELAGTFPIVDQSEEFIAGYTTDSSAVLDLYKCVVFGDHSCTVKLVNFPFCRGADGTQIILSNDESSVSTYQLYQFMKHLKFDGQYKRHFSFLKQHLVPIKLDLALGDKFNNVVEQIFNSIRNCRKDIMSLIQVRDTLLPLLMNGQVEVK